MAIDIEKMNGSLFVTSRSAAVRMMRTVCLAPPVGWRAHMQQKAGQIYCVLTTKLDDDHQPVRTEKVLWSRCSPKHVDLFIFSQESILLCQTKSKLIEWQKNWGDRFSLLAIPLWVTSYLWTWVGSEGKKNKRSKQLAGNIRPLLIIMKKTCTDQPH